MGVLRAKRALQGKQALTSEENSLLDFLDALGGIVHVLTHQNFNLGALPDVEKAISVFQSFLKADAYKYGSMDSVEEFINNLYTLPISKMLGIVLYPGNTGYLFLRYQDLNAEKEKIAKEGWVKAPEHTAEIKKLNVLRNQYLALRTKLEKDLKKIKKNEAQQKNQLQQKIIKIKNREQAINEVILGYAEEVASMALLDNRLISPLMKDQGISEGFYKAKFFRNLLIKSLALYKVLNQDNALQFMKLESTKKIIDDVSKVKVFVSDYMKPRDADNQTSADAPESAGHQGGDADNQTSADVPESAGPQEGDADNQTSADVPESAGPQEEDADNQTSADVPESAGPQEGEAALTSQLGAITARLKQMTSMNIGPIPPEGTEFLKSDKLLPTLLMGVNVLVPVLAMLDTITTVAFGIKPPIDATEASKGQYEKNINAEMTNLSKALGDYGVWTVIKNIATKQNLVNTMIKQLEKNKEDGAHSHELQIFKKMVSLAPEIVRIYENDYQSFPAEFVQTNQTLLAQAISKMAKQNVTGQQLKDALSLEKLLFIVPVHMSIAFRIYSEKFLPAYKNAKTYADKLSAFKIMQREAKQDFSAMCKPFIISNEIIGMMLYELCDIGENKVHHHNNSEVSQPTEDESSLNRLLNIPLEKMTEQNLTDILDEKYSQIRSRYLRKPKLDVGITFSLNHVQDLFDTFFDEELKDKPEDMYAEQGLVYHQKICRKAHALFELFQDFGLSKTEFDRKVDSKIGVSQTEIVAGIVDKVIANTLKLEDEDYFNFYLDILKSKDAEHASKLEDTFKAINAKTIDDTADMVLDRQLYNYLNDWDNQFFKKSLVLKSEYSRDLRYDFIGNDTLTKLLAEKTDNKDCQSILQSINKLKDDIYQYEQLKLLKSEALVLLRKLWCDKVKTAFPEAYEACNALAQQERQAKLASLKINEKNSAIKQLNDSQPQFGAMVNRAQVELYRSEMKKAVGMLTQHHVKKSDITSIMKSHLMHILSQRLNSIESPVTQKRSTDLTIIQDRINEYEKALNQIVEDLGFGKKQACHMVKSAVEQMLQSAIDEYSKTTDRDKADTQGYLKAVCEIGAKYGIDAKIFDNHAPKLPISDEQHEQHEQHQEIVLSHKINTPFKLFVEQELILKLKPDTNPDLMREILEESFTYVLRHRNRITKVQVLDFSKSSDVIKGFVNDYVQSMLPILIKDPKFTVGSLSTDHQYVNDLLNNTILPSLGISGEEVKFKLAPAIHLKVSPLSLQYLKAFKTQLIKRSPSEDELKYALAKLEKEVGRYVLESLSVCALSLTGDMNSCEEKLKSDLSEVISDEALLNRIIESQRKSTINKMMKCFVELSSAKIDSKKLASYEQRFEALATTWNLSIKLEAPASKARNVKIGEDPISFLEDDVKEKTFDLSAMHESKKALQSSLEKADQAILEFHRTISLLSPYNRALGTLVQYISKFPEAPSETILPTQACIKSFKDNLDSLKNEEKTRAENLKDAQAQKSTLDEEKMKLLLEIENHKSILKTLEDEVQQQNEVYTADIQAYEAITEALQAKNKSTISWSYPKIAVGVVLSFISFCSVIGIAPLWWFHRDAVKSGISEVNPWYHMFERMGTLGFRRQHTYLASMEAIKQHEANTVQKQDQTVLNGQIDPKKEALAQAQEKLLICQESIEAIESKIATLSKPCEIDIPACETLLGDVEKTAANLKQANALREMMIELLKAEPLTTKPVILSRKPSKESLQPQPANTSWLNSMKSKFW